MGDQEDERSAAARCLQAAYIECGVLCVEESRTVEADESRALSEDIVTDVACATLVDVLVGDHADSGRRLFACEQSVGADVNRLVLICNGVSYVTLCHCRQGNACEQCQHKYILCFHIRIHFSVITPNLGFGQDHISC